MDLAAFIFFLDAGLVALALLFFLGAASSALILLFAACGAGVVGVVVFGVGFDRLSSASEFKLSVLDSSNIETRVGEDVGDEQSMMTLAVGCRLAAAVYKAHAASQNNE